MQVFEANGVQLHVNDSGPRDAPAIVFGNSLGTDLRVWDALIPHLPDGLRLVRYDKRGHGLSANGPELEAAARTRPDAAPPGTSTPDPAIPDLTIADLADDAAALIRGLGLGRTVYVGLSIGGLIGQSLAARHPGLLAGLVISNSAARIGTAEMWHGRIATIRAQGLGAIAAPTMERWFSAPFRAAGHHALWQRMLERQPAEGYVACCGAIAAADLTDAAATLDLPVQLIAGDADGATPPDVVRATADLIPGARHAVIAGTGHLPCVETPAAHAAILSRFLTEVGHVA